MGSNPKLNVTVMMTFEHFEEKNPMVDKIKKTSEYVEKNRKFGVTYSMDKKRSATLHTLLLLILCGTAHSRLVVHLPAGKACKERYGFMPCSSTALGNVFLIAMYGYFVFMAAQYRSRGSKRLTKILGRGSIVARLFLPVFVALPDSMLILVSGLTGSRATAQSQVSVGMGLLSGSTVILLTVIWGFCILFGNTNIHNDAAEYGKDTKVHTLPGSGITTDIWTCYTARIMAISIVPFLVVQLPQLVHPTSGRNLKVLVSLIVSVTLFVSYCLYQVFQPQILRKRIAYATVKHIISGLLLHLKHRAPGRLLADNGEPNREVIEKLFNVINQNKDGHLQASELKELVREIRFDEDFSFDVDETVRKLMKHFDTSKDSVISREEFIQGLSKWLNEAKRYEDVSKDRDHRTPKFLTNFHRQTRQEHALLGAQAESNEIVEAVSDPVWTSLKAILRLLVGTMVAAAFADPLVDAVEQFSDATSVPSFFISFIVLPWATSSGEAVSSVIFAIRKKLTTSSKTLSELYDTVTVNNVLCQSVFFALVYSRGLAWDFSGEVLVMMIVCFLIGSLASFRTTFPAWTSTLAFLLYTFSLALFMLLSMLSLGHKT